MSRYVRQKLWEAARALAGDGDIEKRIRFAGDCLIGLQEDQIPVANLEEFLAIRVALFTPSGRNYVPRQVSKDDALALSRRIVDLFAKILGGLETGQALAPQLTSRAADARACWHDAGAAPQQADPRSPTIENALGGS